MRNSKDVLLLELRRVLQVALDQARHEVLPAVPAGPSSLALDLEGPPLRHLLARDARDQVVRRVQRGDVLADGVAAQEDVELRHLADDAVVLLAVVYDADRVLVVRARGQEPEGPPEGHLAEHVEGEEVQPLAQVDDGARRLRAADDADGIRLLGFRGGGVGVGAEGAHARDEELDGVVDEGAELAHRRHRVRHVGHLLLHRVHLLAHLGEDVRVLGRREHAVEVGLVEPLPGREDVPGDVGRGERDLIGSDADHGPVCPVEVDVVPVRVLGDDRSDLPQACAGREEGAGDGAQGGGIAPEEHPPNEEKGDENGPVGADDRDGEVEDDADRGDGALLGHYHLAIRS